MTLCHSFPSADERFDATFHTNVLVNASGYCQYIPPGILKSTCYIDVRWFPFDVQKCDLKFGSWTHNGWLLDLQMLDVDTSTYIPNGEWDLVGKRTHCMVCVCCQNRRLHLRIQCDCVIQCIFSFLPTTHEIFPAESWDEMKINFENNYFRGYKTTAQQLLPYSVCAVKTTSPVSLN